jgi:hypothetical protein
MCKKQLGVAKRRAATMTTFRGVGACRSEDEIFRRTFRLLPVDTPSKRGRSEKHLFGPALPVVLRDDHIWAIADLFPQAPATGRHLCSRLLEGGVSYSAMTLIYYDFTLRNSSKPLVGDGMDPAFGNDKAAQRFGQCALQLPCSK